MLGTGHAAVWYYPVIAGRRDRNAVTMLCGDIEFPDNAAILCLIPEPLPPAVSGEPRLNQASI